MTLSSPRAHPLPFSSMTSEKLTSSGLTIEELSVRTEMSVRNIRAHQSRGLLEPPRVVGRTGYYDEEHVSRIELIRELQAEGYNLEAIRLILESAGDSSADLLSFTRIIRAPYETEQPEIFDGAEIARPWGGDAPQEEMMKRMEELGLMRPLGDGRYEVLSPKLLRAGVELAELGVKPEVALNVLEALKDRSAAAAEVFIDLFNDQVWQPFDDAGRPSEDWPRVQEALGRMRPLASDAFLAAFQIAMEEASEKAIGIAIRRELDGRSEP